MIADNGSFVLSAEMVAALMPQLESLGIRPPELSRQVPTINLGEPIRDLGIRLGGLLGEAGLYRFGPSGIVKAMREDKLEPMTPVWFCSWVARHVKVVKTYKAPGGASYDMEVSMGKDIAAKLLETDELLRELPRIHSVVQVRIPVLRKNGTVELCSIGWDREAQLYCTDDVSYDLDWNVGKAMATIERYCAGFPFANKEKDESPWNNRSFLVHVAAMLGVYVRKLLPPGTIRPLIFYMANDQGSGKSLLVSMILSPTMGLATAAKLPKGKQGINEERFETLLDSVALSLSDILWLDDVPANIWSHSLNAFITAPGHAVRPFGKNDEIVSVPNVTQVMMTGNMPEATRDLMQRALVCELYLAVASETVEHELEMSAVWLAEADQRSELLSALWALVANWIKAGMPSSPTSQKRAAKWSRLVGGVLAAMGVQADPFEQPDLPTGGDRETEEWKDLLVALADSAEEWVADQEKKTYEINMEKLVDMARQKQLLVDLVGSPEDKALKGNELKRIGRRLAKWRGREDLRTTKGRRFQFGKRKQASNWVYPISWLDPWQDKADP